MNGKKAKALRRLSMQYAQAQGWNVDAKLRNARTGEVKHADHSAVGWYLQLKKENKISEVKPIINAAVGAAQAQRELDLSNKNNS